MTNTSSSSVSRRNDANDAYDGTQGEGIALCSALTLTFIPVIVGKLTHHNYFCEEKKYSQETFVSSCRYGVCWSVPRSFQFASIHLRCRLWIPPMDHVRWKRRDQQANVNLPHDRWHSFLTGLSCICSVHNVWKILHHTLAVLSIVHYRHKHTALFFFLQCGH